MRGKQREQINHAGIKVVELVALKIQHTHNFIPHQERDGDLRLGPFDISDIAAIFTDIGGINRTLELGCSAGDALAHGDTVACIGAGASEVCSHVEFLFVFIYEQHCAIAELKVVVNDGKDLVEYFVQVKRGEDRLAGVVQNGNLLD